MTELHMSPLDEKLPFGIRIRGVTRGQLAEETLRHRINDLFVKHGMIIFEDVEQSDAMQLAISACFGPLKDHPVKSISRVDGDRLPGVIEIRSEPGKGIVEVNGKRLSHWLPWHFDHCYNDELNRAGVLRPVQRTEEGGVTGFLDGVALYNLFPERLLAQIEGRDIIYTLAGQFDDLKFGRPAQYAMIEPKPLPPGFKEQSAAMPRAIHPAVWTRPSGEKCLHVSPYMADGILGLETPEGNALLEDVCQTINHLAPQCAFHHKWSDGEMAIWDNLRMLHCVSGCAPELTRLMFRTTIAGDYGLGRWEGGRTPHCISDAMA
jgi:taurine dioxygenase